MTGPAIDVVIVTRDRPHLISACVQSVARNPRIDVAIHVVDQSSGDATAAAVGEIAATDSRVHHIPSATIGSSLARNEGLAATSAPVVLFTDDDCVVGDTWVDTMQAELLAGDGVGVFGVVRGDEADRPAAEMPAFMQVAVSTNEEREVFGSRRCDLSFGHGASMGFLRSALEAVGGFDPLLGSGCPLRSWPERDLGFRLMRLGMDLVRTPDAVVVHRQWRDWSEVLEVNRRYAFGAGAAAMKYIRSGDAGGVVVLASWFTQQGFRQVVSGFLRWRDFRKVRLGLINLLHPWIGLVQSLRHPVERDAVRYRDSTG